MATNEALKEIAKQLRQPEGDKGLDMATMMNETNISMTKQAIHQLDLQADDCLLELGHGNCGHLSYLFQQNESVQYHGLEMSALMQQEATRINQSFVKQQRAHFHLYNGIHIPFASNYFEKIVTVNTVYFWLNPTQLLLELFRVLKDKGILAITFAHKNFMLQLPFTAYGFTLYDVDELLLLVAKTPFEFCNSNSFTEVVKTKTGEEAERTFSTLLFRKAKP